MNRYYVAGFAFNQGEPETMDDMRVERDSMGEVQVPAEAYYGAQTQRAVENFPISGWRLPTPLVRAPWGW